MRRWNKRWNACRTSAVALFNGPFHMLQSKPLKPRKCKACAGIFTPARSAQKVCDYSCALKMAIADRAKRELKEHAARQKSERADTVRRKQAMKTIPQLEEECRGIVQKIARIRDRNDGCISCELPANWDGQWHGSHFRSHGAASAVQFNLWNINKSCWICNKLYSGRIDQYEPRLVAKRGQDKVDWLKAQNQVVKNSREYLARFKKVMGKRLRRMEKKLATHG